MTGLKVGITTLLKMPALFVGGWLLFLGGCITAVFVLGKLKVFGPAGKLIPALEKITSKWGSLQPMQAVVVDLEKQVFDTAPLPMKMGWDWIKVKLAKPVLELVIDLLKIVNAPFVKDGLKDNSFWITVIALNAGFGAIGGILGFYQRIKSAGRNMPAKEG